MPYNLHHTFRGESMPKAKRPSQKHQRVAPIHKNLAARPKQRKPLWSGPEEVGVTQSMLQGFMQCRERFRLRVIDGLDTVDAFNQRIEYGNLFHLCEEVYAGSGNPLVTNPHNRPASRVNLPWERALTKAAKVLAKQYPLQLAQVEKCYQVCRVQFPVYVKYWKKNDKASKKRQLLSEYEFKVPYELASGRTVILKGKWDGVSLEGTGKAQKLCLDEHKTKGDVDEQQLQRQLTFDMQTMFYVCALQAQVEQESAQDNILGGDYGPVRQINYNVIRRPLAGGKYSIKPLSGKEYVKKPNVPPESMKSYYARLGKLIEDDPSWFFMRWQVQLQPSDITMFRQQVLDPLLGQLCEWYDHVACCYQHNLNPFTDDDVADSGNQMVHWRHPFGVYDVLGQGGVTDLDEYLATGSTTGLQKATQLFPELGNGNV